jgi:hypothetical protein
MDSLDVCLQPTHRIVTSNEKKTQAYFKCCYSFVENTPANEMKLSGAKIANLVFEADKKKRTRKYDL